MKLLNLKIKPSGMPNQRVYGHVDSDWVNDLIGQTVQGYRDGMNYYKVGGKPIHIYNATEISDARFEITGCQDNIIKAIDLLFSGWGKLKLVEDYTQNYEGFVLSNFILKEGKDAPEFINLINDLKFNGINCFPAPSGIVIEIFQTLE